MSVLALIETASNQSYIFETNRLRDAIGASFLIKKAAKDATQTVMGCNGSIVLASSGKVEARFDQESDARDWIRKVTIGAIEPGMDLAGTWIKEEHDGLDRQRLYGQLERLRAMRGGPRNDHRMLPWLRPCPESGMPAVDKKNPNEGQEAEEQRISDPVWARRKAWKPAINDFKTELNDCKNAALVDRIEKAVESEPEWVWRGIIHADANGLGRIFLHFDKVYPKLGAKEREKKLDELSKAVERATKRALIRTLDAWGDKRQAEDDEKKKEGKRPDSLHIYPLILGGDDVSLICDGRWALYLATKYLEFFQEETGKEPAIVEALKAAEKSLGMPAADRLHACAGVAITRSHFPFSGGYHLAEELCKNAKNGAKRKDAAGKEGNGSAIDWHLLLDASAPSLEEIRARIEWGDRWAHRRPYRVGEAASHLPPFTEVVSAVEAIRKEEAGRRALPSSQLHDLRRDIYISKADAEAREKMLSDRLGDKWKSFKGVWKQDPHPTEHGKTLPRTGFVDALDTQDFLKGLVEK